MSRIRIDDIIRQLNELQDGSLWFDQSFRSKLDHLSEQAVFVRPFPEVHSVAEHVAHMIAWRKECIHRYGGLKYELMNAPEDWPAVDELRTIGWVNLKTMLYESTGDLIHLFDNQHDDYLNRKFQDTDYNNHYLIEGIIQHDIYHLGQIGVTVKLLGSMNRDTV